MNIVVACKILPDDRDIFTKQDGSLDFSKAPMTVSAYDLNAIEAAANLAESLDSAKVIAISIGEKAINDSKIRKNILARGVDELYMIADDQLKDADTNQTAHALASIIRTLHESGVSPDLIICGDGSADDFVQQVDTQLAALLDLPILNGIVSIKANDDALIVERMLEDEIETVQMPLPAIISVSPDIALPRICGMREILAAGKKPASITDASDLEHHDPSISILETKAPEQTPRACNIFDANACETESFVSAVVEALN